MSFPGYDDYEYEQQVPLTETEKKSKGMITTPIHPIDPRV